MRFIFSIFITLALTACNSMPKGVSYHNAPALDVSKELATVVLIRLHYSGVTSPNTVTANGKDLVAISQGQYTWLKLPEGQYTFTETTPWYHADLSGANANSSSHSIKLKAGRVYYLAFQEELQSMQSRMGISYAGGTPIAYPEYSSTYARYWEEFDAETGESHMKLMLYVAPFPSGQDK